MAFTSFLIDQARRRYEEQSPSESWGEGEPAYETKHGPWFRARITVREPREDAPPGTGYRYLAGDAELLFGIADLEGGRLVDADGRFIAFGSDDLLEVMRKGSERVDVWRINTGVEPIRRVRGKLLGFKVGLTREDDATVQRGG